MTNKLLHATSSLLLAAFPMALFTSCFSDRAGTSDPVSTVDCSVPVSQSTFGKTQTLVAAIQYGFRPDSIVIARGTTVTWINCDLEGHTTTADHGEWSAPIANKATFTRVFEQAGRFTYHCVPHPTMTGVIVVQ